VGALAAVTILDVIVRLVRIAGALLAHYLLAAYRYGSEELLRALRIAIGTAMSEQLSDHRDTGPAASRPAGTTLRILARPESD
jgi:hypothetical protein